MSQTSMTLKVPGKLMVAGEFAVLEPHHRLIVMAVDRFVYATVESSDKYRLSLEDFQLYDLPWKIEEGRVHIESSDPRIKFAEDAMSTAVAYLLEQSANLAPFQLSIKSELDDASGVKYGLGSSAAVVVAVISSVLHHVMEDEPQKELIFKLAAMSHIKTQGNGSGADVAASSYGGFLQYTSFQAEWLSDALKSTSTVTDVLEKDWIYHSIQPVYLPDDVYVCIGWTGKPASTKKLVDEILQLKADLPGAYGKFLRDSRMAVNELLKGINHQDTSRILTGVKWNRTALAQVGNKAGVEVETKLLSRLCDLAEAYGGAGKPSGAGGGDCGIAFMPSPEQAEKLMNAWAAEGIKPLALHPYLKGAEVLNNP
ncbi:phosphomevalonate kinase [Virgibacillus xinjiangensis]|uniref:phosphomevalonate kinase n=1 Tax=Virgibacillus xinjiangensis TaxID=393090 RepID=A0ABV7CZ09_9BACI